LGEVFAVRLFAVVQLGLQLELFFYGGISPVANRGWSGQAERQLERLLIL
jgi:hypothetical protein